MRRLFAPCAPRAQDRTTWLGLPGLVVLVLWCFSCNPNSKLPVAAGASLASGDVQGRGSTMADGEGISISPDSPRIPKSPSKGLFWIDAPDAPLVDFLLSRMDEDEILSQVFLTGWPSEFAEGPIVDWISASGLGGIKIFGWNGNRVETLAKSIGDMQRLALSTPLGIPLITATDQEGGWVRHIKDDTSSSPGNLAIGATALGYDAWASSVYIARELAAMGINMNFAPTVDVYIDPDAHVIGPRAFGSNPQLVSTLSLAAYQGMEDERVIATAKHFPGHGNAVGDSHGILPVIREAMETLESRDLVPYRNLIAEGLPAIMVGHLAFPLIDPQGRPATLSPVLNRDLLRGRLGFDGVVITDDLYMGGAWEYGETQGWKLSDIVIHSLKAGNDMVMVSRTPDPGGEIWRKLRAEYRDNPEFHQGILDSVKRILRLKLRYLKTPNRVTLIPQPAVAAAGVPAKAAGEYFDQLSARSVSWIRGQPVDLLDIDGDSVVLMAQDNDFLRVAAEYFPQAKRYYFPYNPFLEAEDQVLKDVKALAADASQIFFCLSNPNSRQVLQSLKPWADRLTVLSTLSPVYLRDGDWVQRAVAVYGWDSINYRFGMAALLGAYRPEGQVPLHWFVPK